MKFSQEVEKSIKKANTHLKNHQRTSDRFRDVEVDFLIDELAEYYDYVKYVK